MNRIGLTLFSVLAALPLHAEVRTGGAYTILTDVTDSAGGRAAAGLYTDEASLGGLTGPASVTSPAVADRAGYIAQVAAVAAVAAATGITITASPLTVNEGGTRQLNATLLYDDSTTAPLAAGSVTWSVQSGPLSGISTSGVATAAAVYQDTAAVARGTYLTFTATVNLTVLNVLPDNFGTYAGDGLPDDWQVQYFGVGNPLAGPQSDPDGDGSSNEQEWAALTDPSSAASVLRITGAVRSGANIVFTFPSVTGRTYTLWRNDSLTAAWINTGQPAVIGDGTAKSFTTPAPTPGITKRFYRIKVE